MILVTGGIFQHKLDFIYEKFLLTKNDVGTKIIYKFNHIVKNWIEENKNIEEETKRFIEKRTRQIGQLFRRIVIFAQNTIIHQEHV